MYHKHNTEGIILAGFDRGDSNRAVCILTEKFGLITARVQSARSLSSKLRYSTQDFSLGRYSLLKGKNEWKLVGGEVDRNFFSLYDCEEKRLTMARVLSLIERLSGEEKNENLYEVVLTFLSSLIPALREEIKIVENLAVLRILKNLGFLKENQDEIESLAPNIIKAVKLINQSLEAASISS